MLINLFQEVSFKDFIKLDSYKNLPLNEQKAYYDQYISDLAVARQSWVEYQNKGILTRSEEGGGGNTPLACSAGMDVVFIIDYTASMRTAINDVKTNVISIVDNTIITESGGDYRLGLVIFDEYGGTYTTPSQIRYGTSTDYTDLPAAQRIINQGTGHFQVLTAMEVMSSQNQSSFKTQLNLLNTTDFPIGNGDGLPEPGDLVSEEIVDNNFAGSFRNNVAKLCIIITDALPGGDNDTYDQDTIDRLNQVAANASNNAIQFLVMSKIAINNNTSYRILSDNTQGVYTNNFTPADIIQAIEDICIENA